MASLCKTVERLTSSPSSQGVSARRVLSVHVAQLALLVGHLRTCRMTVSSSKPMCRMEAFSVISDWLVAEAGQRQP